MDNLDDLAMQRFHEETEKLIDLDYLAEAEEIVRRVSFRDIFFNAAQCAILNNDEHMYRKIQEYKLYFKNYIGAYLHPGPAMEEILSNQIKRINDLTEKGLI